MTVRNLDVLFHAKSVVVVGGSDRAGSLGERVLGNIVAGGFKGEVVAINPHRVDRDGVTWHASLADLKAAPELAVVVSPAKSVVEAIGALGAAGCKVAVVITAGLEDVPERDAILAAARPHGLRIVGPNCLGVLMPHVGLNASFAPRQASVGGLAFISQSGALVTAMLDWAAGRHVGFSGVVSVGDMADADLGDMIDMFAADPGTRAILLYVEGVTDAAKFLSAARAASRIKPVVAIKAGRTAAARGAAFSHTRALAGAYDVYAAAFRRAGIVQVESMSELFDAAAILERFSPHCGDRLAIVSNGGGAGVLAADAALAVGATLPTLSVESIAALDRDLPAGWSRANPIDVVGDARPERFGVATKAALGAPDFDAVLVIHCPTAVASGIEMARAVVEVAAGQTKPVIACWMGTDNARAAHAVFDAAGIPVFDNLDDAVRGYGYLLAASRGRAALLRAPADVSIPDRDRARARDIVAAARGQGRTILAADEVKAILSAYGIPVAAARLAETAAKVAGVCAAVPPPYAIKLVSPQLPHKSDVGGVELDLADARAAVAAAERIARRVAREHPEATITGFEVEQMIAWPNAREAILGIIDDPTFGPVLLFGSGGKSVEVIADRALELPPLDDALAGAMIDSTRMGRLMAAYRDVPAADRTAVIRSLNALAALATDVPDIAELDINPLLVDAGGVIAVDGRIALSGEARASRAVIRPAPMEWSADLETRSGIHLHVRPVLPTDESALATFFEHVSPEDLRFRFLTGLRTVGRDRLAAMCQIDYRRTINFLAFIPDGTLVATAMLAADPDRVRAELAVSVRSDFKERGISWTLVQHVLRYAEAEGIRSVESVESADNRAALALEHEAGFAIVSEGGGATEIVVRRALAPATDP